MHWFSVWGVSKSAVEHSSVICATIRSITEPTDEFLTWTVFLQPVLRNYQSTATEKPGCHHSPSYEIIYQQSSNGIGLALEKDKVKREYSIKATILLLSLEVECVIGEKCIGLNFWQQCITRGFFVLTYWCYHHGLWQTAITLWSQIKLSGKCLSITYPEIYVFQDVFA